MEAEFENSKFSGENFPLMGNAQAREKILGTNNAQTSHAPKGRALVARTVTCKQ